MPWWGWIILGLLLLGSELLIVDAAFYLVFIGTAAILTGVIGLVGIELELWLQWIVFSFFSLFSMILFRKRFYRMLRGPGMEYSDGLAGETIRLEAPLDPGEICRQNYRGTTWTIANHGSKRIEANSSVKIDKTEGLEIIVSGK